MYVVRPYLNLHENIRPPDVMYSMRSYHEAYQFKDCVKTDIVRPAVGESFKEIINRNQLKLIEELIAFIDHLSKTLICSSTTKVEAALKESKTCNIPQQRFAFRKVKVCTSSKDEVDRPSVAIFSSCSINTVTLFCDIEVPWLKNLAKVGSKTSVLFEGLNDGISTPRCTIKLKSSENSKSLVAEINGIKVSDRIAVWKLLGALTSLYPINSEHADICTHVDYWLLLIDDILSNRSDENNLCRQMCTALGQHDYLVPNVAATLADVLAYSFITKQSYYANNVELWLQRMDKLLQ